MPSAPKIGLARLRPPFSEGSPERQLFRDFAVRVAELDDSLEEQARPIAELVDDALQGHMLLSQATAVRAAVRIVADLAAQGWTIRLDGERHVEAVRPTSGRRDVMREKARVRAQELVKRDEQLRTPAARSFIKGMERNRLHGSRFVSIFSLMRDGRELSASLAAVLRAGAPTVTALRRVLDPYLVVVDKDARCPHTGLLLQDIWRYFRHTWTNQYTSTPGRTMAFLVRDRARPEHPIIGIGALGSPIVQIKERDRWIGWHPDAFLELARDAPSDGLARWMVRTVETALGELHVDDFVEEELLSPAELRRPSPTTIEGLRRHGAQQRELHHRFPSAGKLKRSTREPSAEWWLSRATTHLYRSKRALALADLLESRHVLNEAFKSEPSADGVRVLTATAAGRRVIKRVLRKAKADRVGIAMADLTVCGSVAPYNDVLGGKLVSMLSVSPELVAAYRSRYLARASEIASSMAGRTIVRPSELVFVGTTSLYGAGSSQYNRLRMPAEPLGALNGERLEFVEVGKSEAYGTSHFSAATVDALVALVQQGSNGQRVNSIFGEGVSPKFRKIRQGLETLKFPSDTLLQHGRQRIVYGVPLARNLREYLLGMDAEPDYIFDIDTPEAGSEAISSWWMERWLSRRIAREGILDRVAAQTLVRPIRHGARVLLPPVSGEQPPLFEALD